MDNKRFYAVKITSALTQMNEKDCSRVYHLIRGMDSRSNREQCSERMNQK